MRLNQTMYGLFAAPSALTSFIKSSLSRVRLARWQHTLFGESLSPFCSSCQAVRIIIMLHAHASQLFWDQHEKLLTLILSQRGMRNAKIWMQKSLKKRWIRIYKMSLHDCQVKWRVFWVSKINGCGEMMNHWENRDSCENSCNHSWYRVQDKSFFNPTKSVLVRRNIKNLDPKKCWLARRMNGHAGLYGLTRVTSFPTALQMGCVCGCHVGKCSLADEGFLKSWSVRVCADFPWRTLWNFLEVRRG